MYSENFSSQKPWTAWVLAVAGLWLSCNLMLDFLVMPVMYFSGMTTQSDFATAGYTLFWSFNRLELLFAAIILTGALALRRRPSEFEVSHSGSRCRWALIFATGLFCFAVLDTYVLAPHMSSMAISLNSFDEAIAVAPTMGWLHGTYWVLDCLKASCLGGLAWLCFRDISDRLDASGDFLA